MALTGFQNVARRSEAITKHGIIEHRRAKWEKVMKLKSIGKKCVIDIVNSAVSKQYVKKSINSIDCFASPSGFYFRISSFPRRNAIIWETAENEYDASANLFEDSQLYYLDDYETIDELVSDVLNSIKA